MYAPRLLLPALLLLAAPAFAAPPALRIEPASPLTLAGRDASRQLIVTRSADGRDADATRDVKFAANPPGLVAIDANGTVTPLKEGTVTVTATAAGGLTASATLEVSHLVKDVPVSFPNQVVPIFTRFGCNAGGCHGKASGQNGFKLSLLGFEPTEDHEFLVKEGRGRRLLPAAPASSLLITKATGQSPHGGGKKIEPGSPYYSLLVRWVEQGAPYGKPSDPTVTGLDVFPPARVLAREAGQQLAVVARMSDGTTVDVTRLAQFESNTPDVAAVSPTGLVSTHKVPGVAAVMARFQSHVAVFRATVPLGAPVGDLPKPNTVADEHVFRRLKELGLPPSPAADDATFVRRATLDLCGRLPTPAEVEAFVADTATDKDAKLVDRLLEDPAFADWFSNKWAALLRNRRKSDKDDPKPTAAFRAWVRGQIAENKPFDETVRAVLTARGDEAENPAAGWYREVREPAAQAEDVAQLFMGQRIGCAKCHHHPFEKWSQQDYYGLVAFFSRVEVKDPPQPKPAKGEKTAPPKPPLTVAHKPGSASAVNPRTKLPVKPTGLAGPPLDVPPDMDPREKLADWLVDPANPFFARTLANRTWKHFMGRGIVEPEDDVRVTNPPTNPELLDALAKAFVDSKYDLKAMCRLVCTSRVYRLSAVPNAHNADDRQNFSRFLPKRLPAEVLLDAIDDVTQARSSFKGQPAGTRAVQLPDNLSDSYFLGVFGRPDGASACECERTSDATLAQCLHMFNSSEVLGKVKGPRAQALAKDKRPHAERLRELYVAALSRPPSADEEAALLAFIEKKPNVQEAYEDIVWALVNTKEFLFNH